MIKRQVRVNTWSGDGLTIDVDSDGDVGFTRDGYPNFLVNPGVLRDALRELGVIPEDAARPLVVRRLEQLAETVSRLAERMTALSRDAAGRDQTLANHNERLTSLEATVAEMRREPKEGDRYRDKDGDVWRVLADGRLQCGPSGIIRDRAFVGREWGPLVPIDGAPALPYAD